ncbi:MAG: tetratricopeptide repeat protein [Planctomycetes bacterium]|nr:tetratricopeptide repeat protein [Planctomycetota bacterium]
MDQLKKITNFIDERLLKIPFWIFWPLLFSSVWFYIIRRVISWDLWWHMAAGRFIVENGYYPPTGTFTFSPTTGTLFTSKTWLGDVIFHLIYTYGGFYGLQVFRGVMILSSIFFMLHILKKRYTIWSLLIGIMMVIGTMQKHLIKNAIYVLFFMSFISWSWVQIKYNGKRWLIWTYPPILIAWTHIHGSVYVGYGFLLLIIFGDLIDQLILLCRKKTTDFFLVGCLVISLGIAYQPVNSVWGLNYHNLAYNSVVNIFSSPEQDSAGGSNTKKTQGVNSKQELKAQVKLFFRKIFGGTDAKLVAEYQWPFEILYVLSVRLLFLLVLFYTSYLIIKSVIACVTFGEYKFLFSFEFPCLALTYIALGYLRTVSYPFLVVFPFMLFSLAQPFPKLTKEKKQIIGAILLGISLIILGAYFASPPFQEFVRLFHEGLCYKIGGLGDGYKGIYLTEYICYPFYFIIPVVGTLFLIGHEDNQKLSFQGLRIGLGLWTLGCIGYFALAQNQMYKDGLFHKVSGFLDTEPGLGKSNKFFKGLPEEIVTRYPDENIYNSYNMGGYLLWQWYGQRKVFIDGRSIIYDNDFYQAYTRNNAQKYIEKHKLNKAILSMVVDKDRIQLFLSQGWSPVKFDPGNVIMEKPKGNLEACYGTVPEFVEGERSIADIEALDREYLGLFYNNATTFMLKAGRFKDTKAWLEQSQPVLDQLPEQFNKVLKERMKFITQVTKSFGDENHRQLGVLCQKIFNKVKGAEYHKVMGDTAFTFKKYADAKNSYLQVYQTNKKDSDILHKLGNTFYQLKQFKDSAHCFQEAIKLKPKQSSHYNGICMALINLGDMEKALQASSMSIKVNPNGFEGYFNSGVIFERLKKYKEAKVNFEKVLKLQPNFAPAKAHLDNVIKALTGS